MISLHRAILEQYDETGERLENQTYLDTEGGPITRYVRVDYQLRNGTSLRREWRVSIVNGSDVHRLLTQLVTAPTAGRASSASTRWRGTAA